MTVSSLVPVNNYTGNGSTCQFDFDFLIEDEKELVVTLMNKKENTTEQLIFGVDYSINEVGSKNGSFIVYPLEEISSHEVLSPDEVLTLSLDLSIKQESEFENSATLKLDVLEWTFDYIVRVLQILSRKIDRSVKIVEGDNTKPEELVQNLFDAEFNSKVYSKAAYQNLEEIKEMSEKIDSDMQKLDKELKEVLHKSTDEEITGVKNFTNEILYKGQNLLDVVSQDYENALKTKQDVLSAGDNITIKNNVISAEDGINNKIANCLLEVPQRIKYDLTDGVLTIKAGSKVIVPNGFEEDGTTPKFDEIEITSDLGVASGQGKKLLYVTVNENVVFSTDLEMAVSGETDSLENQTYHAWYDTTNNIVKRWGVDINTYSQVSLPFALCTFTDSTHCSIDQIFNGFGYIGSTVFVDKGVKGLIPNGRNSDGTLNNIEYTTNKIATRSYSYNIPDGLIMCFANGDVGLASSSQYFVVFDTLPEPQSVYERCFVEKENKLYYHTAGSTEWIQSTTTLLCGTANLVSGQFTDFQPKLPFRAVDWNDNHLPQVGGQWVASSLLVAENVSLPIGNEQSLTYDLSEYLPVDEYDYEVVISCNLYTGATVNSYVNASFKSWGTQNQNVIWHRCMGIVTRSSSPMDFCSDVVIPIGKNRKFDFVYTVGTKAGTLASMHVEGYRRLGTNQ